MFGSLICIFIFFKTVCKNMYGQGDETKALKSSLGDLEQTTCM